jgi:hypothetical protein
LQPGKKLPPNFEQEQHVDPVAFFAAARIREASIQDLQNT